MTQFIAIHLFPSKEMEEAWQNLEDLGWNPLWSDCGETDGEMVQGSITIFCEYRKNYKTIELPEWVAKVSVTEFGEIDWAEQWQLHGENWQDGYLHIYLTADTNAPLRLQPGPGFGDLSHPTTKLVLQSLEHHAKGTRVIDIGSGSGILSLAAIIYGAQEAIGIEIDREAIEHATDNAILNGIESQVTFFLPDDFHLNEDRSYSSIALMNMISSEQQVAWQTVKPFSDKIDLLITSGIRVEEKDTYLRLLAEWQWIPFEEKALDEWMCFLCHPNK